ncbi:tight junction protein ZO-1-like isoform X2 [Condylostylus longicornis]|uniref:tight junction protein ZO-1-like isoform X2 n=1 Tax=Condylostylus longicornis TaxID=2530218 RepID=UPI00244DF019|nr:tight junction protein ZO-1-like isoform X2 [Condylostylus longicornis]
MKLKCASRQNSFRIKKSKKKSSKHQSHHNRRNSCSSSRRNSSSSKLIRGPYVPTLIRHGIIYPENHYTTKILSAYHNQQQQQQQITLDGNYNNSSIIQPITGDPLCSINNSIGQIQMSPAEIAAASATAIAAAPLSSGVPHLKTTAEFIAYPKVYYHRPCEMIPSKTHISGERLSAPPPSVSVISRTSTKYASQLFNNNTNNYHYNQPQQLDDGSILINGSYLQNQQQQQQQQQQQYQSQPIIESHECFDNGFIRARGGFRRVSQGDGELYWIRQRSDGILTRRRSSSSLSKRNYIKNLVDDLQIENNSLLVKGFQAHRRRRKGDRTTWEYHTVSVTRVPGYGFGIAVSGGRDNPHFANGDPSIAVSDVLKGGPAEDRLQVNDRIISVNGVSLENVEYATAVQVLRDSGNTVTLVVKRRVPINTSHQHTHSMSSVGLTSGSGMGAGNLASPVQSSPPLLPNVTPGQPIKVVLTKASKKEDFGIVLGCRLFIKEISSKARDQLIANGYSLQEGDVVTRIHNTNCNDSMSMKEAKKIIDGCKERLNLVVLRDITNQASILNSNNNINNNLNNSGVQNSNLYSHAQQISNCSNNLDDPYLGGANYSSQNLYVQPPTRGAASSIPSSSGLTGDEKSNLTPRGRSRGPIMDVSQLSQLDRPSTPPGSASRRQNIDEPPRPPPPRGSSGAMTGAEDFYSSRRQLYEEDPLQRSRQSAEPRFISFQKEGSVGIRLTGGNEAGIFVTAVQPGSPASLQGLTPGDKILKVNDMDMHGVTREEAVLFLLSLQDRIDLIVQHCKDEYDEVVANQRGDSFHIKTHFHCENPSKGEMAFKAGDVFRVIDTLHNGVVGSWQVLKIGRGHQEMQRGVIPNKSRAEELATAQFNATKKEMNASESRGNFFRRRRSSHRRSKSLSRENWDDVVFSDAISKFPAYERVVLRHPGFVRPVVLFGPVSDIAREKLTKDFPDKFTAPLQDDDKTNAKCRIVRLSNIRDIMDRGKHALLDITPNAVDRLNYAQFYPIVLFLKADTKHTVKQLRQGIPKSAHKSSKKLLEQCQKLEKVWSHIFSTTITLTDTESWYRKLRESIDLQQSGAVWMSESKPVESLSDDFLFPMTTSRLSYASSPESDLELSPGPSASLSLGNLPQLVKSSSDPSIATNQDNLDRDRDIGEGLPPPYTNPYDHTNPPQNRRTSAIDNKFGFGATNSGGLTNSVSGIQNSSSLSPEISNRPQSLYGINAPDLPPRIDRGVKPPGTSNGTTTSTNGILSLNSGTPSRTSSSGGTIGRTAQERLFGNKQPSGTTSSTTTTGQISSNLDDSHQDEYITRNNTDSIERTQNSLERHRIMDPSGIRNVKQQQLVAQNGSYDSVSSYDSYNTTQLSMQNLRLGPNAPDDLNRPPPPVGPNGTEYSRGLHNHSRSFGNANDLNRQNSPGRPGYHEVGSPRNIDARNSQSGINHPQRPSNLILDNSPRKPILETKTDYGKYSRNNSASQADYASKIGKGSAMNGNGGQQQQQHQQQQQQQQQMSSQSLNGNGINNIMGNTPFKPVPPPKPKNYRPPIQQSGSNGQMTNSGHWDNGEPGSPRSPNGFFYPPTPSHYHHNQASGSPHHSNGNGTTQQAIHAYGHYNAGQQQQQQQQQQQAYQQTNGYNSGYGGQYSHRGPPPPPIGIMPHLTPERHALDLAGSREQRGSAFELYRKPQIGAAGHHHNMSDLEPYDQRYYYENNQQMHHQQSSSSGSSHQMIYSNEMNDPNYRHFYANNSNGTPPPLPPPLPPPKTKKKSVLKSPLAALKNAFIKSTKPLRRMNSMVEPERVAIKPCIRRQYSMNERNMNRVHYPEDGYPPYATQPLPRQHLHQLQQQQQQQQQQSLPYPTSSVQQHYNAAMKQYHEPYYPNDGMLNSTYQNLESEDIYTNSMRRLRERQQMQQQQELDDLYANRALIDLERRQADSGRYSSSGRRIIRRHSTADRTGSQRPVIMQRVTYDPDDIYQSRHGAYMLQERRAPGSEVMVRRRFYSSDHSDEPTYQSRREMHRSHLYQSKKEMQERIAQGKREIEREFSPPQSSSQSEKDDKSDRESMYQSRKEVRESLKSRSQLREQIYQTRRDTLESMAEPTYVSKRDIVKHEPIYETKEENTSKENITDERKTEEKVETENENCNSDETTHSDLQRSNDTVVENTITQENNNSLTTKAPLAFTEDDPEDDLEDINDKIKKLDLDLQSVKSNSNNNSSNNTPRDENKKQSTPLTPSRDGRPPFHISNILKRTAPPPTLPPIQSANDPTCDLSISRTSIETHYTSQASLPVGPPNATSTPYASDMSLPIAGPVPIPSTNVKLQQPLQQQKQSQQQQHTANTSISLSPAASSSSPIKPNIIGATGTTFPIIPREPSTTHGVFDENGGTLCDNVWNVSLIIPSGAIAPGVKQEVYFTVTDPRMSQTVGGPPLDMENGETMLSPLVMCGPQGLEFNVPVTLNIPHCAGRTASLGLALKATDSEKNLHTEWDNIDLPSNTAAHTVSVKVDHF